MWLGGGARWGVPRSSFLHSAPHTLAVPASSLPANVKTLRLIAIICSSRDKHIHSTYIENGTTEPWPKFHLRQRDSRHIPGVDCEINVLWQWLVCLVVQRARLTIRIRNNCPTQRCSKAAGWVKGICCDRAFAIREDARHQEC